jgi:hypothetical protein
MIIEPRFLYRGDASGVAATITHTPDTQFQTPRYINVRGASSLPQIGGISQNVAGPEHIPDELHPFLQFEYVRTFAFGREENQLFVTDVIADVSRVQLGNEKGVDFRAELLHAQLRSTHSSDAREQPRITWRGTNFVNVRLALGGVEYPVIVNPDRDLEPLETENDLVRAYREDPAKYFQKFFRVRRRDDPHPAQQQQQPPDEIPPPEPPRVANNRYIMFSLVESLRTDFPGAVSERHVLSVPDFGKIFFGEVTVAPESKTLVLLRFKLGSPDGGEAALCAVRSNGEPVTN